MIRYQAGGFKQFVLKIFHLKGSVFPHSLAVSLPCAGIAMVLRFLTNEDILSGEEWKVSILLDNSAWSGFSVLVGFLIIFRTSQAYGRFWGGCSALYAMRANWFDASAGLVTFCQHSKKPETAESIRTFQSVLIRLVSLMHAAALGQVEDSRNENPDEIQAYSFELLDAIGLDDESLSSLVAEESKVELLFTWIQNLVTVNINLGVLTIPPPILTRCYGQLSQGMVMYHDALQVADTPFPFPYAQMCDFLLTMHWFIAPIVSYGWVKSPAFAFLFCFIQVFILWALNFIAVEIENPFGTDQNDIDGRHMQREMNRNLLLLVRPHAMHIPKLKHGYIQYHDWEDENGSNPDRLTSLSAISSVITGTESFVEVANRFKDKPTNLRTQKSILARSGSTMRAGFHHQSSLASMGSFLGITRGPAGRASIRGSMRQSQGPSTVMTRERPNMDSLTASLVTEAGSANKKFTSDASRDGRAPRAQGVHPHPQPQADFAVSECSGQELLELNLDPGPFVHTLLSGVKEEDVRPRSRSAEQINADEQFVESMTWRMEETDHGLASPQPSHGGSSSPG